MTLPPETEAAGAAEQTPSTTETTTQVETPAAETQTTETTTETTPAASETTAREKLEANVRAKLAALSDEDEPEVDPDATVDAAETEAASQSTESSTGESDEPKEAAAVAVTPAASTLPAAHVRSLKAYGLTDAEIAKTDPTVAAAIHSRRNQEITRWAEEGRRLKETQTQTQQPAVQQQPAAPQQQRPQKLDIAALKQQYGDEPLIAALEQQEAELTQFRTFRQQFETQAQHQHLETLSRQIDGFFTGKELEPYRDVYGTTSATLSPQQSEKRAEVLRLADAIVGGARQNGQQLSVEQALQHAFDSVSAPIAKQAARQEITKQLKTRGKGVTLKPGARTTPKASTRQEMERNVRGQLRKIFS